MKNLFLVSISFLLIACAPNDKDNSESNKEADMIRASYNNYKLSALNADGETAVNLVSENTIAYFHNMSDYVVYADSVEIESMRLFDKLMIFTLRHKVPTDKIQSFDGKSLFIYGIDNGLVGNEGINNQDIGEITIDNDLAKGQMIVGGQVTPFCMNFKKENNKWTLDLISLFAFAEPAFQQMIDESGMKDHEYIFMLLEMLTAEYPDNSIWHPLE